MKQVIEKLKFNKYKRKIFLKYGWRNSLWDVLHIWSQLPISEKIRMILKQFYGGF